MPWSNQGGGGWKGGGGPWGQGPGGGGNQQPDLEEIFKRSQDRIKQAWPGSGMNKGLVAILALLGILITGFYMFTVRVNPDEQGIVTRFGKYDHWLRPGLNFRLPAPIEVVYTPKVTNVNALEMGFRRGNDQRGGTGARDVPEESLMLTGDENIVDVDFTVFWRIKAGTGPDYPGGAPDFLFNIKDGFEFLDGEQPQTLRDVAESAMREVVGKSQFQPILTQDRVKTEDAVKALMQKTLDAYRSGIEVTQVQLQNVNPPTEVIDAFRDVQAAKIDFERVQNEARSYANKVVPEARGDAQKILQEAQAYRDRIVAEARGQSNRFLQVYEEYKKAPAITRQRLYLETMERVLGGMDKTIIDQQGQTPGVVPYLNLNELTKRAPAPGGQ